MDKIRLTKEGRIIASSGDGITEPIAALHSATELERGWSLRSFCNMLRLYPELQSISDFLPVALAEAETCPAFGCQCEEVRKLVLGKTMELIGFPGKPRAEMYTWLRGMGLTPLGAMPLQKVEESAGMCGVATELAQLMQADKEIRFIPLAMLLDVPIYLGGLQHVVLGDINKSLMCETRFMLFEVIDGLAWEFGFHSAIQHKG